MNIVYRIRRKFSGYTWFEAHGALHTEQGKGKKCLILVGRERPVYALDRTDLTSDSNLGESELWSKMSTAGMFLHVSSNSRIMLDRVPEDLVGTSLQSLMRPDSKKEFMRKLEVARSGEKITLKHDLQNRRGQVLHAQTTIYPGDAQPGFKPTFLLAQTRLLKMTRAALLSQRAFSNASTKTDAASAGSATPTTQTSGQAATDGANGATNPVSPEANLPDPNAAFTSAGSYGLSLGSQDEVLASDDNIFDELKTTRSSSWQFELRQMERQNRLLAEELQALLSRKKKRKRRKGLGQMEKDCANCHTRVTPEWRRGPSGNRDLCNSCGLRWAKQVSIFYFSTIDIVRCLDRSWLICFSRTVGYHHENRRANRAIRSQRPRPKVIRLARQKFKRPTIKPQRPSKREKMTVISGEAQCRRRSMRVKSLHIRMCYRHERRLAQTAVLISVLRSQQQKSTTWA